MAFKRKKVVYNGGTLFVTSCSSPSVLTKNRVYEVVGQEVSALQVNYKLKGFPGTFNAEWFNDLFSYHLDSANTKTAYIGFSYVVPSVGIKMEFARLNKDGNWGKWNCSKIEKVTHIGNSVYLVETKNSRYFLQVN